MQLNIYDVKPALQRALRPLARLLHQLGITAEQITLAGLAVSLLTGALLCFKAGSTHALLLLPPALLIRMALSAVDSTLAKEFEIKSRFGAMLSELSEVISEAALYLPLALGWRFSPVLIVLFVVLAVISEMTGVLGLMVGSARRYDGPLGTSERAAAIAIVAIAVGIGVPTGVWQNILLAVMLVLLANTIYNRARMALWRGQ